MKTLSEIFISSAQAQETATPAKAAPGGSFGMFLPMVVVFVIFYLLLIRPQQRQRKQHQQLLQGLKKGDEVVTSSGLHGKVYGIADSVVTLEIAENTRIKVDKNHVATIKPATTTS